MGGLASVPKSGVRLDARHSSRGLELSSLHGSETALSALEDASTHVAGNGGAMGWLAPRTVSTGQPEHR